MYLALSFSCTSHSKPRSPHTPTPNRQLLIPPAPPQLAVQCSTRTASAICRCTQQKTKPAALKKGVWDFLRPSWGVNPTASPLPSTADTQHPVRFVLGCCLGMPPPARACTNRGTCCHKLQRAESEPPGVSVLPSKMCSLPPRISNDHHGHQCTTSQSRCPWESRDEIYRRHPATVSPFVPETSQNSTRPVHPPPQGSIRPTGCPRLRSLNQQRMHKTGPNTHQTPPLLQNPPFLVV
jgi:hypothetical protein